MIGQPFEAPEAERTARVLAEAVGSLDEHVETMTAEARMLRHEVADNKRRTTYLTIVVGIVLFFGVALILIASANRSTLRKVEFTQDYLVECTTPGPRAPTADDPRTGHHCFDAAQQRTAEAVQRIIDALRPPG